MIVATFLGMEFLGVKLCARVLGTPDFRDGMDDRRIFWDLKFSISGFFWVGKF